MGVGAWCRDVLKWRMAWAFDSLKIRLHVLLRFNSTLLNPGKAKSKILVGTKRNE